MLARRRRKGQPELPVERRKEFVKKEFQIPASGYEYIDVGITFLHVVASIRRGNGTPFAAAETSGPVNNFLLLQLVISDFGVTMNKKLISLITAHLNLYPYRAYLETLFNYNDTAKTSHQTLAL
ncbi:hypothetical protein B566_EDAN013035 [Ephemera danica]|nr:hypothetical protein B566_EDAN013035 [Ephemera danica]